jgi:hypothetical protein
MRPALFRHLLLTLLCAGLPWTVSAQVFGSVRVTVRDPQSLAIADAEVAIQAKGSTWTQMTTTNGQGEAVFIAVPFGVYVVSVKSGGFEPPIAKVRCSPMPRRRCR